MLKILFIVGTLRKDSFNLQLAQTAEKYLVCKAEAFLEFVENNTP